MIKAAFLAPPATVAYVYDDGQRQRIAAQTDLLAEVVLSKNVSVCLDRLQDVEAIFSTWGFPVLTGEQLDHLPKLRAVFYAAGSVQGFARPLLERGIVVASAWRANAVPVAEFTLAQILLAGKGYFRNVREYHGAPGSSPGPYRGPGNYGETVGLLGAGAIGRSLIDLLRPFHLRVIVYDPFLDEAAAQNLGVEKVSLKEIFARSFVVSNHLADKPETAGLLDGALFDSMRPGAAFINTGRGRTVNQDEMVGTLRRRSDLTALLDVTDPEPSPPGSPLFQLPNVRLSTHIAGAIHDEAHRLADYCIDDFERFARGEPLRHAVTLDMLATMA
jgi:phosphoglycerate dehydrogenase-like enzyme